MLTLITSIGFILIVFNRLKQNKLFDAIFYMVTSFIVFGLSAFLELMLVLNFIGGYALKIFITSIFLIFS